MTTLYMKQKVFSWGDKFSVWDAQQDVRYAVEGEVFTWGKKLHVMDDKGSEVAYIWEKVFSFLPRFFIEIGGREVLTIVKELTLLRPRYRIEGLDWTIHGDFWAHEYEVLDAAGKPVMSLSKHWLTWGDSYELRIEDGQDELTCLCLVLAVDAVIEKEDNNRTTITTS